MIPSDQLSLSFHLLHERFILLVHFTVQLFFPLRMRESFRCRSVSISSPKKILMTYFLCMYTLRWRECWDSLIRMNKMLHIFLSIIHMLRPKDLIGFFYHRPYLKMLTSLFLFVFPRKLIIYYIQAICKTQTLNWTKIYRLNESGGRHLLIWQRLFVMYNWKK